MWLETQPSAQSSFQKLNVDNSCQKTRKIRNDIFEILFNFAAFLYYVQHILASIVEDINSEEIFGYFYKKNCTRQMKRIL